MADFYVDQTFMGKGENLDSANLGFRRQALQEADNTFAQMAHELNTVKGYEIIYWCRPNDDCKKVMRLLKANYKRLQIQYSYIEYVKEKATYGTGTYSGTIDSDGHVSLSEEIDDYDQVRITNIKTVSETVEMAYFYREKSVPHDKVDKQVQYLIKNEHYYSGNYEKSSLPLARLSVFLFLLSFLFDIAALVFQSCVIYPLVGGDQSIAFNKVIHNYEPYWTVIGLAAIIIDLGLKLQLPIIKNHINNSTHANLDFLKYKIPGFAIIAIYFLNLLNAYLWYKDPENWWVGCFWFFFAVYIILIIVTFIMFLATTNSNYIGPLKSDKKGKKSFEAAGGHKDFEKRLNALKAIIKS